MNEGLAIGIAYLLGSLPFGLILARLRGIDLRSTGSGNIGATNALRSGGTLLGIATLALDVAKGVAGVLIAEALLGPEAAPWALAAAVFAPVAGHCFPVWLAFRGGKGVATAFGVLLAASPVGALIAGLAFLAFALPTRWVSLGSLSAAVAAFAGVWWLSGWGALAWGMLAVSLTIIVRHHENIRRLISGEEAKLGSR